MAYAEWGDRDNADVVVCAHGLSRNGRDFDTLAKALLGRHRVVCPDIVGRGRSDRLANYRGYVFPQYVADCITLIARLGVDKVSWVGTSMGGLIGMMIAAMPDNPIGRFVINDVGPVIGREQMMKNPKNEAQSDLLEEAIAHEMTRRGPKASLVTYPGVGHAPTLLQADQVHDVVAFIDTDYNPRRSTT